MFELAIQVVLASASPRRRQLLGTLVSEFEVVASEVDEEAATTDDPTETAERLALLKAQSVLALRPDCLVIGGDTVVSVILEGVHEVQLSKPRDRQDAERMLRILSGRTHKVISGLALVTTNYVKVASSQSQVTFRQLSNQEIIDYVATGEPMDKAGAYAVQAGGGTFVEKIDGSRSNVIGLPLELLEELLLAYSESSWSSI